MRPDNAAKPSVLVDSTAGVQIALHDLGGSGPPLLLSHTTGFHGRVWEPLAANLAGSFRIWSWDFRGHGDSSPAPDGVYNWNQFADDVLAVLDHLRDVHGVEKPFAVGHSKGGASLVLAEQRRPGTFRGLYLFEPVLFPPEYRIKGPDNPMAVAARRRRADFESVAAAIENYAAKPPLAELRTDALRRYVEHGFATTDSGVTLKCRPESEASMYEMAQEVEAFENLHHIDCPIVIAAGQVGQAGPAAIADLVAGAVEGAEMHRFEHLGHFGPLQDPDLIATDVAKFFSALL